MSDTENQEDLSVEDILSSIKNILVDENGDPIEETVESENKPISIPEEEPEKEEEPVNDVFNLDDSMIIQEETPVADISQLLETSEEETSSIPSSEPENKDTALSSFSDVDNLLTPSPVLETEDTEVKEETIDASASIINNFAKVFAEKQQTQNLPQNQPLEPQAPISKSVESSIEGLGITDMVKETIINQVKNSLDSHFEQIASNIIANETKQWLNANLASIVEKTVAKEIERVIAKVGS